MPFMGSYPQHPPQLFKRVAAVTKTTHQPVTDYRANKPDEYS